MDQWILEKGKELISEAQYWITFYKFFNIKLEIDILVWSRASAKKIAMDYVGGLRFGTQRSTITHYERMPMLDYNANHVFFVWGNEIKLYKNPNVITSQFVLTGYPYNIQSKIENLAEPLRANGANFIVALFDNGFGPLSYLSKESVRDFYEIFLTWLLDDPSVGLITKEKKPGHIQELGMDSLIKKANETGRFLELTQVLGRYPSDAASCADIAVGVHISSAVMEAVFNGGRGIHWDLFKDYTHPYYEWGKDKIIFDSKEQLIKSLKELKRNSSFDVGDWGDNLQFIQPFKDAHGGPRIGAYLREVLNAMDEGLNREEALEKANKFYTKQWGENKIYISKKEAAFVSAN